MPMAAPNHVDHQPAAGASSSSSSGKAAGGHGDPSVTPDDRDPTRLVVPMLAGTAPFGVPMAAPNPVDQSQAMVMAVAAAIETSISAATAGHCPGVAPDGDDIILTLTNAFATTALEAVPGVSVSSSIRASPDTPAEEKPLGSRAERQARRRTRSGLIRVPTDYLRVGHERLHRRRRRELARRCVSRLCTIHEDRAWERHISAIMAQMTTTPESASERGGDAAPSTEHAGLADLLGKMAISKKH